ncbi:MAG: right-handed parallel beta-helix repeat-containing protein [Sandaracinaceae bacterium]
MGTRRSEWAFACVGVLVVACTDASDMDAGSAAAVDGGARADASSRRDGGGAGDADGGAGRDGGRDGGGGGAPDAGGPLGDAVVHFLDPLGYAKPRGIAIAMPDEATCPNRYYVDFDAGSGSACTESAPCREMRDLIGKPGLSGGPAYVYLRGSGLFYLYEDTFYGSAGNEIVIRPWPGAGLVSLQSTSGTGNTLDGDIHHVILDGGPDLELELVTHDAPRYGLTIRADDVTVYRTRFRAGSHDGPLVDIGSFTTVRDVRFINCEFFDADNVDGAQQNMYWGPGAGSTIEGGLVQNCIFRQLGGEAIELNPRVSLDDVVIEGNAIHDVGKRTCSGGFNCRPAITIDGPSVGGESRHVTIQNNLMWDLGSGGVWDRSGTSFVVIQNNTVFDFGRGGSSDPNPEGISGYSDGGRGTVRNNIVYAPNGTAPLDGSSFTLTSNLCSGCAVAWSNTTFVSTDEDTAEFLRLAAGSPAIDAAATVELTRDYFGEPRPVGASVDIGADEAP